MISSAVKANRRIFTVQNQIQLSTLQQKSLLVPLPLLSTSRNTIENMIEAVKAKDKSAGLAAPQIGINERIIICSFTGDINNLEIMINPTYINNGTKKEEGWEGCFSIPLTFAKVPRWNNIDVSYYTIDGNITKKQLNGFSARVYQHECDHLEGVLMTEQASELKTFPTEAEFNAFLKVVRKERKNAMKGSQSYFSPKKPKP